MKTILLFIAGIVCITISLISGSITSRYVHSEALSVIPTATVTPTMVVQGVPVTLRIPSLEIESSIEAVSVDEQGRMDVPKLPENVSWYEPGVKPGYKGNAVIAGHLNTPGNLPAVFWDLEKLKPGETVYVDYSSGESVAFKTIEVVDYTLEQMPLEQIFAHDADSNLHLITCSGDWNTSDQTYSNRTVVYTEKIE